MSAVVQFRVKDQDQDQKEDAVDTTLLTTVMEASAESLAIIESGRVLRANRAFARIFGYFEASAVEGKALADFIPESLFLFSPGPEPATHSVRPSSCECAGVGRDGGEVRVLAASAVFRTGQRELLVINLRAIDQPEQQTAPSPDRQPLESHNLHLQQLEAQKLEMMGRVVGGVAHDFNNLLTGILLYCDLLIRGLEANSPLRGYVEEIRKAGGHSSGLVQQLLGAARPQPEDVRAHSWIDVITGMQNFLARMLGENIELVTDLDPQAAPVTMSITAMRQVALNLLLNSRDAMPGGGRITVTVRNCADCVDTPSELLAGYVEFTVADTGCGVDAATRAHLGEPFFTTKPPGQGNGLGLATVQRIVMEANGSLQVESEPNQGTRISVRLPQSNQEVEQLQTQISA